MQTEPTLGEVMRRLEDVRQDLRDDLREFGLRLDSKVSLERYELEKRAHNEAVRLLAERVTSIEAALTERITAIEAAREAAQEQKRIDAQKVAERRAADRRLLLTALVAPVLLLLLSVYIQTRGAGA
ncbi:hypothetical protein ACFCZV_13110 [Streptomyces hydrogenans]|uniref:hypothetical protein n=1 Tax=Streptomyces hydrogenans TaxID=1873719 RepID=UPI0035E1F1BF